MNNKKMIKEDQRFTNLHFDDEIRLSLKNAKKEIQKVLERVKEKSATFKYNNQIVTALPCDFPRLLIEWNRESSVDQAVRNILLSSFLSSEEKCSGSAFLLAGFWCANQSFQLTKNKKCHFDNMIECLDFVGGHGMTKIAAKTAIEMGALGHKIEILETNDPTTKVLPHVGKEISGAVDPLFGDKVFHKNDMQDCLIFAIDGTVETVSSVHRILELSASKSIIILAKSFLPDVSNTIAEMWKSGKGKCVPLKIDSWNIENFLDLEKFGVTCVSHERGDIISNVSLETSKSISISILESKIILLTEKDTDRSKIVIHVSKSLGGLTGIAIDRIKTLIGFARISSRSGVFRWEKLHQESSKLSDLYSKDLVMPLQTLESASKAYKSLTEILQGIGCLVIVSTGVKK